MPPRRSLSDRIRACTACSLHAGCNGPVPYRGPAPARYAIVGEAPGREEDKKGEPFIGPAGKLLDQYLARVGLDSAEAFVCNTVCCFPYGTPKEEHVLACRQNLRDQLVLAEAPHVLLLGKVAFNVFWPGESIMQRHGASQSHTDGLVNLTLFATYHPAAVLRNRALGLAWRRDLEEFADMVNHDR